MKLLTKLTTEYSEHEDRLCLTGQDSAGNVYRLWITRRLADRLFANLVGVLDKRTAGKVGADLMQSFAQEQAVQAIEPQEKVAMSEGLEAPASCLVDNVDITPTDAGLLLVFKQGSDPAASIGFVSAELRQWLFICRNVYKTADWPMVVWPDWIDGDGELSTAAGNVAVH